MTDGTFNSAVAAGGRYDNLISDFLDSKDPMPAVGISFGLEPIIELMKDKLGEDGLKKSAVRVYVVTVVPDQTRPAALDFLKKLRAAKIPSDIDLKGRGPGANFKYANAYDIPYVVVIGPDELDAGVVNLKDMIPGEEEQLSMDAMIEKLSHY
jgi:histidyl-tRNA synthetase